LFATSLRFSIGLELRTYVFIDTHLVIARPRVRQHYTAASGKPDLVRPVLDKLGITERRMRATEAETAAGVGADDLRAVVDDKDSQGWTPLHWAACAVSIRANNVNVAES
jgi:hypothetical protein